MKSDLVFESNIHRGFLPEEHPLKYIKYNVKTEFLCEITKELPKLLLTGSLAKTIEKIPKNFFDFSDLISANEEQKLRCLNSKLSFIAHGYIYSENKHLCVTSIIVLFFSKCFCDGFSAIKI